VGGVVEVEQVHVQIPGRRGQVADPLELGREERGLALGQAAPAGQGVAEELQGAAGAPDRDPQVVQELGIGVGQNAGDVRLDGVEQPEQNRRGRLAGRLGGGDDRVDLVGVVARPAGLKRRPR
jgi:hypothetical protein